MMHAVAQAQPVRTPEGFRDKQHMVHSRCVQLEVDDLSNAISIFGTQDANGGMPIVLVPKPRKPWSIPSIQVPSGVYCLMQKGGKDVGLAPPGLQFAPYTHRIAFVVTKQSCTYDAPVSRCPTSDNVMVSVDVTLIFSIQDPKQFVYKLGAVRLDNLLSGAVEEGIRALVRSTDHTEVYSLRGNRAGNLISQLNDKFKLSGVVFTDCKITAVWLPPELAASLEATTKMKSQAQTVEKEFEYQALQVRQVADLSVQEIQRKNEQLQVQEAGKKRMATVSQDQEKLKAEETSRVAIAKAEEQVQVMRLDAEADLRRAKIEAEKKKMEALNEARKEAQEIKLQADLDYRLGLADSLTELAQQKQKAEAIRLETEVEKSLAKTLALQRSHEISLAKKVVLAELAEKGDYNLVGRDGDAVCKALIEGEMKDGCNQQ